MGRHPHQWHGRRLQQHRDWCLCIANEATNAYDSVSGGYDNLASGNYASVNGGYSNVLNGNYTAILGGNNRYLSASYATSW